MVNLRFNGDSRHRDLWYVSTESNNYRLDDATFKVLNMYDHYNRI